MSDITSIVRTIVSKAHNVRARCGQPTNWWVVNITGEQKAELERFVEKGPIPDEVKMLLSEIYDLHRNKEAPEYNQCDEDECFWCIQAKHWIDEGPSDESE